MHILGFLLVLVSAAWVINPSKFNAKSRGPGAAALILGLLMMGRRSGDLFIFAGLAGMILGLIGLVRPIQRLRIVTRKAGAAVLVASFILTGIGAAIAGPGEPQTAQQPQQVADQAPQASESASPTQASPGTSEEPQQPDTNQTAIEVQSTQEEATEQEPKQEPEKPALPTGVTEVKVTRVVDGDTIDVSYIAGAKLPATRVRLIGVDTPESTRQVEPYGKEASAYTRKQLEGKTVWLEKDVSETDRYGRALRYVWLTQPPAEPTEKDIRTKLFNALLVLNGYAKVATYPPDVKYVDYFTKFQREAREADRGLWALSGSSASSSSSNKKSSSGSSSGTKSTASRSSGSGSKSSGGSSGSSKKCDPNYAGACIPPYPPDVDCGDLSARGFRVVGRDVHRLDRDGDGIACER